ncbi:hypothetical protein [Mesorhizobium sp. WSM3864]|uniref:hypothetical protein n=1 Tax=Mesorhizobium sp. WSM3864 TaxID=2029404 RepID=UPI001140FA27|nr:hypothetical protein [Mesorhizobium sp. WSM3864]
MEIRVARTTPRWVGPVAISNHEDVQIEPFGSTLKSREQRGCHILLFEYQLLAVLPTRFHGLDSEPAFT